MNKKRKNYFFVVAIFFLLSGCHTTPPAVVPPRHGTAIDHIHAELQGSLVANRYVNAKKSVNVPSTVSDALLPKTFTQMSAEDHAVANERFDVSVDKMPAKNFFMGLVEGTSYNMVVNPNVTGTISLTLKNVTIDEAMHAVRDVYGYDYRETSYGYDVLPQTLGTRLFNVNYLDIQRSGKSVTQIMSGQISEKVGSFNVGSGSSNSQPSQSNTPQVVSNSSVDTRSEINFWRDLTATLKTMVGEKEGRSVVVNPQAGVVIVRAFPNELHEVASYLDRIQSSLQRQVILEAKILEVELNDQFQSGVDWQLFGKGLAQAEGGVSQDSFANFSEDGLATHIKDFNGMFAINVKGDFGALIKLLQTQGNVQVLSNPRISTVNNQKAVLKVGQDEFFVTAVSTSNSYVGNSNQSVPTQDVGLTPFFSGVTLDVTPQISDNGTVILHIHPSVSTVVNQQKEIELGTTANNTPNTLSLPLALSSIRESDNIVRARNGQVVVIGGLMQNKTEEETAGTPGLSKIPFVGALFRRTQQVSRKSELIILLRPVVVDRQSWSNDMEDADRHFQTMKRGFHWGGLPEVFGTEGERPDAVVAVRNSKGD